MAVFTPFAVFPKRGLSSGQVPVYLEAATATLEVTMSSQPARSNPSGKSPAPHRSFRVVQKPAKAGTISYEQAVQAVREVKQRRLTPSA
jgi:hypothetical protein